VSEFPVQAVLRPIRLTDLPAVTALLDEALGAGFWSLDLGAPGCHRVAEADGAIVGVASAVIVETVEEAASAQGPVGLVRLVAVAQPARQEGLGTLLVEAAANECLRLGAASLAAFAWVHGGSGACPLAGVLQRLGFVRERRLEGFYARVGAGPCPACHSDPCTCAADLYVRFASG
jgi:GNAT superfamily N-acetyltransferase